MFEAGGIISPGMGNKHTANVDNVFEKCRSCSWMACDERNPLKTNEKTQMEQTSERNTHAHNRPGLASATHWKNRRPCHIQTIMLRTRAALVYNRTAEFCRNIRQETRLRRGLIFFFCNKTSHSPFVCGQVPTRPSFEWKPEPN